jgi:AcrR family transcriptional regulator
MSPRGVAIPEAREQLFQAAERVLLREGADGLTSRAITDEAGVAKGLIYSHFTDIDDFLTELILDRVRAAAEEVAMLPWLAGTESVVDNLTGAAVSLLQTHAFAILGIVHSRPSLMTRLHQAEARGTFFVLDDIEKAFGAYLEAERKLGRIAAPTDTETLALTLVGTIHHIFMTNRANIPNQRDRIQRVVAALLKSETPTDLPHG